MGFRVEEYKGIEGILLVGNKEHIGHLHTIQTVKSYLNIKRYVLQYSSIVPYMKRAVEMAEKGEFGEVIIKTESDGSTNWNN